MFASNGQAIQPFEVLSNQPVLIERGSFRLLTQVPLDMLDQSLAQLRGDPGMGSSREPVVVMEMTLNNLMTGCVIDHRHFLARVDTLDTLGKMVMISNYTRFDLVTGYLRKYTREPIAMVTGVPTLAEIFDEKYYGDLAEGILDALSRLFQSSVKRNVYHMERVQGSRAATFAVPRTSS